MYTQTDMPVTPRQIELPLQCSFTEKTTKPGDILIARVGRRCLGRVAFVSKGEAPVSDCIIVVRPENQRVGRKIWKKLSSKSCREYFAHASLGVGAKYITYKTIKDYLTNEHAVTK